MDSESKAAVHFLKAVAATATQLIELAQHLRSRPSVVGAVHGIDCRQLDTGAFLAEYVDVELQNGIAVAWWLETSWSEAQWMIESRVLMNDEQGQDVIKEFATREAETLRDCVDQLLAATADLVGSVDLLEPIAQRDTGYNTTGQ